MWPLATLHPHSAKLTQSNQPACGQRPRRAAGAVVAKAGIGDMKSRSSDPRLERGSRTEAQARSALRKKLRENRKVGAGYRPAKIAARSALDLPIALKSVQASELSPW